MLLLVITFMTLSVDEVVNGARCMRIENILVSKRGYGGIGGKITGGL
jgi:hypothetical protein